MAASVTRPFGPDHAPALRGSHGGGAKSYGPPMDQRIEDLPPPTLVQTEAEFGRLLDAIDGDDAIAVDTEADSFFSYRDKVCLIQVTAGGEDWLVDPFADLDLGRFAPVFEDPDTVKIFHDAEYDVLILGREYGFRFEALFDTRVAAAVLGSQTPGLASVLEGEFGVRLDKSQQRSNWAQRPLSSKQIAYARLDTRFLLPLMDRQRAALEERGRMMIVDSECRRLESLEAPPAESNPDDFVKIKGARTLDPMGASALRELFIMRDKLAEKHDSPPFRILGNKSLIQLAERRPRSERELLRVEGITSRVLTRLGDRLERALDRAERNGPIERLAATPRRGEQVDLDELGVELHERLKRLRRDVSTERQIESSYLLHRSTLQHLAAAAPADREAVEALELLEPWQLEWFADEIVEVVRRFKDDASRGVIPARRRGRRRGGRGRR